MFQIEGIDHVAFTARDIERLTEWYQDVLGMERVYADVWVGRGDPVALCAGSACVALFRVREGEPPPTGARSVNEHFALRLSRTEFEKAQDELRGRGIEFRWWDHKVCYSIYFYDPEGNQIELTTYEV
jgi:catechol 2,3-dioxygenase-like lactoylglutathione lyase family enzyme